MEIVSIIFPLLWRRRPALWLDRVVRGLFKWAIAFFRDEASIAQLRSRRNSQWFGGWLNVIACRVEELIAHRAAEIADLDCRTEIEPWFSSHSCRTPLECRARLEAIWDRYCDVERLAQRRAEKLLREANSPKAETLPFAQFAKTATGALASVTHTLGRLIVRCTVAAEFRARAPPLLGNFPNSIKRASEPCF